MTANKKPTVRANLTTKGNTYYVVVSITSNKKRKQKWINTGLSVEGYNKRKANKMCESILREWEQKIISEKSEMLFSDYLKIWIESEKGKITDNTFYEKRRAVLNVICPYFEKQAITLCDLETKHIEDYYQKRQQGKITKKKVTANTIHHDHAIIHKALKKAVRDKLIISNPADFVELPTIEKHIANFYDDDCLKTFLSYVEGKYIEIVVYLAAWFGLRRGEAAGLRWCDVDFENKVISIRGVITDKGESGSKINNLRYVPRAKTKKSIRELAMPDVCIAYLKKLQHWQENRKVLEGYNHQWDGFICLRPNGDMIPLEYMSRKIPELTVKAGLPRLKLHELRHTNISLLLESGANFKELAEWAGHSTTRLTEDTYAHITKKSMNRLAGMVDGLLSAS